MSTIQRERLDAQLRGAGVGSEQSVGEIRDNFAKLMNAHEEHEFSAVCSCRGVVRVRVENSRLEAASGDQRDDVVDHFERRSGGPQPLPKGLI